MASGHSEHEQSEDAALVRRDDYAAPELKLVGKVSELAQSDGGGTADGVGYS